MLQTFDIWFRPIFAMVFIELGSRAVVHVGVTYHPSSAWVAQQLREATPFATGPPFIIRDNDDKYGIDFDRVARASGMRILPTPYRAPRANAICERCLGSVRRECLDHALLLGQRHMLRLLREYADYFNRLRPHQGIGQRVPRHLHRPRPAPAVRDPRCSPILGGIHHAYEPTDG